MSILSAILFFTSCGKKDNDNTKRIIGKEHTTYKGMVYQIIEVDGVEYLCTHDGGICPLANDTLR